MVETKDEIYEIVTEANTLTCGTNVPTSSRSVVYRKYRSTRSGSQNPKWRDQVKRGMNATTAYTRSGYIVNAYKPFTYDLSLKCSPGNVNKGEQYRRGTVGFLPNTGDFSVTTAPDATSAQNQAIMGFIHDAKAQYNSISGPTFLGELRQTLSMIRNPAKNLKALVQEYQNRASRRRSSFRTRRDAERWLSGLWLEYAFGWVPLISDTKAGAEALARLIHGDLRYSTARGFGKTETSSKPTLANFNASVFTFGQIEKFVKASETCIIKGGVRATASGPTLENAMHLFGFTPEEFVPTVWNLTPWSFLVDYFVNVGDVLEASFFDQTGVTWSSMTTRSERTAFWHTRTKVPSGWSGSTSDGSCKVTKKSMVRSESAPLVPSLEVSLPGSPQQWLNMTALLDQHRKMVPYVH